MKALNKALTHSSLSDRLKRIEPYDISGNRPGYYHYELTRKHNPDVVNYLNKRVIQIQREDMNTYGYWERR